MIIEIHPCNPQARLIKKIVCALKDGAIIAYPTDTCFGIGCDLMNKKSIEKIYFLKKQSLNKPFSFICPDLKDISQYAYVSNFSYRLMRRILPGPYTIILEGSKLVPKIMLTKRKSVGIRIPDNKICIDIVRELGHPIITTSATDLDGNLLATAECVATYFRSNIDIVIKGNIVPNSPSTVISLLDDEIEIIREGLGDISIF